MQVVRAGRVPYLEAWDCQRALHAARVVDEIDDTVLLLEHDPVYTAGKRTEAWERPPTAGDGAGTPVVDVDRGGRITWHGPGQLTGYPIVRLPDPVDVVAYVRRLEDALIETCAALGIPSVTRASSSREGTGPTVCRGRHSTGCGSAPKGVRHRRSPLGPDAEVVHVVFP